MAKAKPKAAAKAPAPKAPKAPAPRPDPAPAPTASAPPSPPADPAAPPPGWTIHTADGKHWRAFSGGQALGSTERDAVGTQFDSAEQAVEAARRAAKG